MTHAITRTMTPTATTSEARPLLVSGDWEVQPYEVATTYAHAFEAAAVGPTWNGWATPLFTRDVAEAFVAREAFHTNADPEAGETHTWAEDGSHVLVWSPSMGEELTFYPVTLPGHDEPLWPMGDGYTWSLVTEDDVVQHAHMIGAR